MNGRKAATFDHSVSFEPELTSNDNKIQWKFKRFVSVLFVLFWVVAFFLATMKWFSHSNHSNLTQFCSVCVERPLESKFEYLKNQKKREKKQKTLCIWTEWNFWNEKGEKKIWWKIKLWTFLSFSQNPFCEGRKKAQRNEIDYSFSLVLYKYNCLHSKFKRKYFFSNLSFHEFNSKRNEINMKLSFISSVRLKTISSIREDSIDRQQIIGQTKWSTRKMPIDQLIDAHFFLLLLIFCSF